MSDTVSTVKGTINICDAQKADEERERIFSLTSYFIVQSKLK